MLDKPTHGTPNPAVALKCADCGIEYDDENNLDTIEEHGVCIDCGKFNFK